MNPAPVPPPMPPADDADWPPVAVPPDGGPDRARGAIITGGPVSIPTYEIRP